MNVNVPFPLLSAEPIAEPGGEVSVGIYDEVTQTMGGLNCALRLTFTTTNTGGTGDVDTDSDSG